MKMKKFLLLIVMSASICIIPSSAKEPVSANRDIGIHKKTAVIMDKTKDASWGVGSLVSHNPLGRKPWAYAMTETHAGSIAYEIKARISADSGGTTDYTSWAVNNNASSVTSATIIARTENNVLFTSEHRIQDTASSSWKGTTITESY